MSMIKIIFKKILPPKFFSCLRCFILFFNKKIIIKIQLPFLLKFWYHFSGGFYSEYKAVFYGTHEHNNTLKKNHESSFKLRRNVHRLEKGLIMKPRRKIFAENFILETVKIYTKLLINNNFDRAEMRWYSDVLNEYFKVVGDSSIVEESKKIFLSNRILFDKNYPLIPVFPNPDNRFSPYKYIHLPSIPVRFDDLKKLFIRRRSTRWYQNKFVSVDLVKEAVNIASFAPSACNRQPYRFLFCNDKPKATAIAECAGGTKGFAENLPSIVVLVGDLSSFANEKDRHLIYIDGSLAMMQFMLALETLGLSSCSINWPEVDANEKKLRKLINLKDYERVIMLLAVGYADVNGGIPYSQKKQSNIILENISQ